MNKNIIKNTFFYFVTIFILLIILNLIQGIPLTGKIVFGVAIKAVLYVSIFFGVQLYMQAQQRNKKGIK